jgi:hypothetical protein
MESPALQREETPKKRQTPDQILSLRRHGAVDATIRKEGSRLPKLERTVRVQDVGRRKSG